MTNSKKPTISQLQQQIGELTEALQRERADAINIRRQHSEQSASIRELVKVDIVEQLLPAVDHLELSLRHIPSDIENHPYVKGVKSVVKQFEKTFTDIGIEKIKSLGESFDPRVHEAIKADEGAEKIVEEVQSGYKLGNIIIRPAKVILKAQ